jgi:hypothetical protein
VGAPYDRERHDGLPSIIGAGLPVPHLAFLPPDLRPNHLTGIFFPAIAPRQLDAEPDFNLRRLLLPDRCELVVVATELKGLAEPGLPIEKEIQRPKHVRFARVVGADEGCDPVALYVCGGDGAEVAN